jgi:hypothetical protein
MKTKILGTWTAVGAVLTLTAFQSPADQPATTVKQDKTYTGTVASVNPGVRTLKVKGFLFSKRFNLGTDCAYVLLDNPNGAIGDLRPGEKVKVGYQDANGVLVADRVQQEPMKFSGMVKAVDPAAHTVLVHSGWADKTFRIPDDCQVVLRGDKSGSLADLQTGNHVTVIYETPNDKPTARRIAQTSATFAGELTAVDMGARTVKAKTIFGSKTFHLGDNCAIVVNGKVTGHLSDLQLGHQMEISYNDVNGVNVADRIGPATTPQATETTSSKPMTTP